jgi:hypothetical protein
LRSAPVCGAGTPAAGCADVIDEEVEGEVDSAVDGGTDAMAPAPCSASRERSERSDEQSERPRVGSVVTTRRIPFTEEACHEPDTGDSCDSGDADEKFATPREARDDD